MNHHETSWLGGSTSDKNNFKTHTLRVFKLIIYYSPIHYGQKRVLKERDKFVHIANVSNDRDQQQKRRVLGRHSVEPDATRRDERKDLRAGKGAGKYNAIPDPLQSYFYSDRDVSLLAFFNKSKRFTPLNKSNSHPLYFLSDPYNVVLLI